MKRLYFIIFFPILFLTYSCKESKINTVGNRHFQQKISIHKTSTLRFELDSLTTPTVFSIQEYNHGNDHFLIYLNEELGTTHINDLNTQKLIKTIRVEGDNKKYKKAFQATYFYKKDSIFLFSYNQNVILINENGKILRKYFLSDNNTNNFLCRGLYVSTNSPAYVFNNKLIISSVVVGTHKELRPVQIFLDLKTGKVARGKVTFPKSYSENNYGGLHYDIFSSCINPKNNSLIYSFPANKTVTINKLINDSIYTKPVESQYIIDFLQYNKEAYKDAKSEKRGEYFMTTPSYGSIYYDEYKNVYYRLGLLPVDEKNANYEEKNPPLKHISLVIYDENFNYLGEKLLDKNKFWSSNGFVSSKGFNIQNRTNDDSTLDFTTFNFKVNKE